MTRPLVLIRPLLWVLLAVVLAAPMATRAQEAATPPAAAVAPAFVLEALESPSPYFAVEGEPGAELTLAVALGNAGEVEAKAITYVADAYTLINGGFGVYGPEDAVAEGGPTTWIDYPTETLMLEPGLAEQRAFTVAIPEEAEPGQYISGLVVQSAEPIAVGESGMIQQIVQKAIAVMITVPGPVEPGLEIGEATVTSSPVPQSVQIAIANTGNVLLKPTGLLNLREANGDPVLTTPLALGSVYAGMATTIEVPVTVALEPGDYQVELELEDEASGLTLDPVVLDLVVTETAAPKTAPVTIESVAIDPVLDGAEEISSVSVAVTLENPGVPLENATLTLIVTKDGEELEEYPLNTSLLVPAGETDITQRYLPAAGWESGDYTFAVRLDTVDPSTGAVATVATADAETVVTVP